MDSLIKGISCALLVRVIIMCGCQSVIFKCHVVFSVAPKALNLELFLLKFYSLLVTQLKLFLRIWTDLFHVVCLHHAPWHHGAGTYAGGCQIKTVPTGFFRGSSTEMYLFLTCWCRPEISFSLLADKTSPLLSCIQSLPETIAGVVNGK